MRHAAEAPVIHPLLPTKVVLLHACYIKAVLTQILAFSAKLYGFWDFLKPVPLPINPRSCLGIPVFFWLRKCCVYNLCEFPRLIIFHFGVDVHGHLAVFVPCEILYGLWIHAGSNQVSDIGVSEDMWRSCKVQRIDKILFCPAPLSQLMLYLTADTFPINVSIPRSLHSTPCGNIMPHTIKLGSRKELPLLCFRSRNPKSSSPFALSAQSPESPGSEYLFWLQATSVRT